ncbi:PAS domain-containing protein [Chloroflexota bacterium]
MPDEDTTKEQLLIEIAEMRERLADLETMNSIRRQKEELLKETEDRLRAVFELAPDAYYISDLKGNFLDGNAAAEEMIGYKREDVIGKSFLKLDLLSVSQIGKAAELLAKNAMGQSTGPDEFIMNRKDGSRATVAISTIPVKVNRRTLVLGFVRNIDTSGQVEHIIQNSGINLDEVFESVNDGIIRLDETGKILDVNKKVEEIFGFGREEVLGRNFSKLGVFSLQDLPKVVTLFGNVLKGDVSQLIQLEPKRKDGSRITIEANTGIIKQDNRIKGIVISIRDITSRKINQE